MNMAATAIVGFGTACLLVGCAKPTDSTPEPPVGTTQLKVNKPPSAPFGGLTVLTNETATIDAKRPILSVTCDEAREPSLFIDLIRAPSRPPPLRQVFLTLRMDGKPIEIEAAWGLDGRWSDRDLSGPRKRHLVIALAKAKIVMLEGLGGFAPVPVTWRVQLPAAERARFIRQCGGDA